MTDLGNVRRLQEAMLRAADARLVHTVCAQVSLIALQLYTYAEGIRAAAGPDDVDDLADADVLDAAIGILERRSAVLASVLSAPGDAVEQLLRRGRDSLVALRRSEIAVVPDEPVTEGFGAALELRRRLDRGPFPDEPEAG